MRYRSVLVAALLVAVIVAAPLAQATSYRSPCNMFYDGDTIILHTGTPADRGVNLYRTCEDAGVGQIGGIIVYLLFNTPYAACKAADAALEYTPFGDWVACMRPTW